MAQTPAPGQLVKLIGRTTDFKGKTLWEIVGNLKNYGVGRIVIRNMFQRYKEPCFMRIVKVEAAPNEVRNFSLLSLICYFMKCISFQFFQAVRKVHVVVEEVFRGVKVPEPVPIFRTSYKADYILIPKDKEKEFVGSMEFSDKVNSKILPKEIDFPPLLKQLLLKETGDSNMKLELQYVQGTRNSYRLAAEGEKPTIEFSSGLGTPASPNLYKNVLKN